ncbi:YafY family protein [Maritimibacter sp. UBA3975]|uniref:helix-turn-helix transcriptional regulator n=1 Tax=Maritimibacter sp. UBA3975 TaxID=1946833 RepID=UPI000C0932A3|nr:YafY family protein [Maritimibacter sp. UBA3975]MAM62055.1 DNA-binding transcriptional regulator [Maritimibacter sp.]|tara:strand:- start:16939 stop:17628 length:690 start_codon:yes stop_codon:yes gene_type:complete
MRRADRLFQIVQYLRGGRLTTARSLAERLEVSERTIYRDVADLIGSGVPIEGEAGVGYVMRAGYDVPPLMFTREEVTALVAGARMARVWGGLEMARAAEEALIKIEAVLPDSLKTRAAQVPIQAMEFLAADPVDRARLDTLESAAESRTRVRITYEDETGARTERTVRPLALLYWGKVWTLAAWCETRQDFRNFRVDRIWELDLGDRFAPDRTRDLAAFLAVQSRRPLR